MHVGVPTLFMSNAHDAENEEKPERIQCFMSVSYTEYYNIYIYVSTCTIILFSPYRLVMICV